MKLKWNKIDIFILSFALIFIILLVVMSNIITSKVNGAYKHVVITIRGEEKYKYNLDEDRTIVLKKEDYDSLLGDMVIEIKDGKVRVNKEESPKNYCSKQGWVSNVATPIVCLPNAVVITIIGQSETDLDWQV